MKPMLPNCPKIIETDINKLVSPICSVEKIVGISKATLINPSIAPK